MACIVKATMEVYIHQRKKHVVKKGLYEGDIQEEDEKLLNQ